MEKTKISASFTIDDIHKIREYHYEVTKNMTTKEWCDYFNKSKETSGKEKVLVSK